MFGNRRKRAASNPPLNGSNANPSATTAAAQAFLNSRASNASLSSAAAAAALRSRPTTPTSVADVQTKRTMRRAGSNSSMGSTASGRPQLERRGSSGSMSERSFREPSPSRSSQPVPSAVDAPPVPAIPKNIQPSTPPKSHRRAASLEAPPMRIASPPPNLATGRGSSLGPTGSTPPRRSGPRMSNLSSVQELTGVERPASRGSVNFSLPTGSRPTSPVSQRRLTSPSPQRANLPRIVSPTNQNFVYDPNTRSFLPQSEIYAIEQRLQDAANKPVKKKKRIAPNQATGTHLADGTVGGRPRGTAIDAMEASQQMSKPTEQPAPAPKPVSQPIVEEPEPAPASKPTTTPLSTVASLPAVAPVSETASPKKKKKKVVVSDSDSDQGSYIPNSSDNDSDFGRPSAFNTRAGTLLAKKPSIVREEREREEQEDDTQTRLKAQDHLPKLETGPPTARTISPSPLPRSVAGRGHGKAQASASTAFSEGRQQTRSASQPPLPLSDTVRTPDGVGLAARDSVRNSRVQSVSPARTTHFAATPDSLVVKHQPPLRSISPRKSALKQPSTPRGQSPEDALNGNGVNGSEGSDELAVPRKKANRVSFDETNVIVGQAATPVSSDSPIASSPQAKKPWYSLGRGKKKGAPVVDDDDEVMKPRPALPSFGSIREKKAPREVQERPLVKPAAPEDEVQAMPSPPLFTTPTGEVIEYSLGQSNDHIVGSVLSQDAATKNAANISKSREPLPPQVTSVEGTGYNSETNSSVTSLDVRDSDVGIGSAEKAKAAIENSQIETYQKLTGTTPEDEEVEQMAKMAEINATVPEISVLQATPTLEDTNTRREWPDMPGGWRNSHSDSGSQSQEDNSPIIAEHKATEPTLATVGIAEPSPEGPQTGSPVLGDIAAENAHAHSTPAIIEETESETDGVYSDAAEDLSDLEGDGFMSLDAVVDSPAPKIVPGLAISTPPDSPTTRSTKERAYAQSQLSRKTSEPDLDEGWEKAREYWKGLSAEKRRQLELEAKAEAEGETEGSDTEIEVKPKPKPKKKKKKVVAKPTVVSPPATFRAQRQPDSTNERSYMIQPGSKAGPNGHAPMRTSMRAKPPSTSSDSHMRKSMRSQGPMRDSMRGSSVDMTEPKVALQKKQRPVLTSTASSGGLQMDPDVVNDLVKKLTRANAAAAPAAAKQTAPAPTLRRKGSGDSDSSFKRTNSRTTSEIPSFRRSMRGSNEESASLGQSPMASSRFSLRSLSPTGSAMRRPFSGGGSQQIALSQTHMRSSMRSSTGQSVPTLRGMGSSSRAKSPLRLPGFGRSSLAKPSKQKSAPNRSSRFADSSDEDEGPSTWRSRFDSSDEDEPLPRASTLPSMSTLRTGAPVRRIPRSTGVDDGDSSDLPDSDDEKPTSPKLNKKRAGQNGTTTLNQGTALTSGSLRRSGSGRGTISPPTTMTTITGGPGSPTRPNNNRRGSFMSILRRKKPDPSSKVRKSDAESPARRDTPLERSKFDLAAIKSNGDGRPTSPKLQKRNPLDRQGSGSWPLPESATRTTSTAKPVTPGAVEPLGIPESPPNIVKGEDERPFTSDGEVATDDGNAERPGAGIRRFTATGLSEVDIIGATSGGAGAGRKKKKFGALRRMFRLDD